MTTEELIIKKASCLLEWADKMPLSEDSAPMILSRLSRIAITKNYDYADEYFIDAMWHMWFPHIEAKIDQMIIGCDK